MGLLQHESLADVLPDTRRAAMQQVSLRFECHFRFILNFLITSVEITAVHRADQFVILMCESAVHEYFVCDENPLQIKGLANWASAQESRKGGDTLLARHHSRLIMTLVQCLRLAFTGAPPLADSDVQYASVEGTGE